MKHIIGNIFLNIVITEIFVLFYTFASEAGYADRFITIALIYGSTVVVANAVFIVIMQHRTQK